MLPLGLSNGTKKQQPNQVMTSPQTVSAELLQAFGETHFIVHHEPPFTTQTKLIQP